MHAALDAHPSVVMSEPKEPNYFAAVELLDDSNNYYKEKVIRNEQEYSECFNTRGLTDNVVLGEASVSYFHYDGVAENIHTYNSDAKIIIILRDPVERAWSHYLMDKRLGYCDKELSDIINNPQQYAGHYRQYIGTGFYEKHIQRYEHVFGEENILVLDASDLHTNPEKTYRNICDFVGIAYDSHMLKTGKENTFLKPKSGIVSRLYATSMMRRIARFFLPDVLKNTLRNILFAKSNKPVIPSAVRIALKEIYADNYYWQFTRRSETGDTGGQT